MNLSDIFYDYLESPEKAQEAILARPPMALAFLGFLTAAVSLSFWDSLKTGGLAFFIARTGSIFLWNLFAAFLWAALLHLYVSMKSPEALPPKTAKAIIVYFGLADFSWALAIVAAFIFLIPNAFHYLSFPALAAAGFLNLALKARGVKSVYRFSGPKAWLLILTPYAAFLIFGICFLILSLSGFFLH